MTTLLTKENMQRLAKIAMESAMQQIAKEAEEFAADPRMLSVNGRDALLAFSRAMLKTNAKVWPKDAAQ